MSKGGLDRSARQASLLAVALLMGGCSSEVLDNWTPTIAASTTPAPADLTQPNYRRIVGDNIRTVLPKIDTLGDLEISSAQLVDHLNGPAWLTCLKLDAHGKPQHYALFIQGDKIIDSRAGVLIDQCHKKAFERFDLPPPPTPKQQGSNSPSAPAR